MDPVFAAVSLLFLGATAAGDSFDDVRTCLVSTGDLDGDGHRDILMANRDPKSRECVWAISSRRGTVLFRVEGTTLDDGFGGALAEVGDANGDGVSDFAVNARGSRVRYVDSWMISASPRVGVGYTRVVSGADGSTLREFSAPRPGNSDAYCVASAGNVDSDGVADVLVSDLRSSRPCAEVDGFVPSGGIVRVHSGASGELIRVLAAPRESRSANDAFGTALAALGDLDGDGRGEVAVAAPGARESSTANADPTHVGRLYVISGGTGRLLRTIRNTDCTECFAWALAAIPASSVHGQAVLAFSCTSRNVQILTSRDWEPRLVARSHCWTSYLDEFGTSLEFAVDPASGNVAALAIGANECPLACFDEGYAMAVRVGDPDAIALVAGSREGIDVCALDDLDGDERPEFAFVAMPSMTLTVHSSRAGQALHVLRPLEVEARVGR